MTPTLRSVTTHAPYFHDGRAATIEDAVDYMPSGGIKDKNPNLDSKIKAVKLSAKERTELLAFLKALDAAGGCVRGAQAARVRAPVTMGPQAAPNPGPAERVPGAAPRPAAPGYLA